LGPNCPGLKCLYTEHTSNKCGHTHCIGAYQLQRSACNEQNELAQELVSWKSMRLVSGAGFRDRKFPRTFVPGSGSSREQKFLETEVPGSD